MTTVSVKIYFKRFVLLFFISLSSLLTSPKEFSFASAGIFLLFTLITCLFIYNDCSKRSNLMPLFELNKVLVIFTSLIWAVGILLALESSLILGHGLLDILVSIDNKNICWFLTLVSLSAFFSIEKRYDPIIKPAKSSLDFYRILSALFGYIFIVVGLLDIPLSVIGGSGTLTPQIYQSGACIVFGSLSVLNQSSKIFFTVPILVFSIPLFYEDKRETIAVFLIYTVYNLSNSFFLRLPSAKNVFRAFLFVLLGIAVILIQSIARGYGGFVQYGDAYSFIKAIPFIFEYLRDSQIIGFVANNFEVSSVFASGTVATYMATQMPLSVENIGSTLVKVFYAPLTLFNVPKPDSFISLVTSYIMPSYRAEGGSYPAYFPSEIMYNLNFLLPILPLVIALVAIVYSYISYCFLRSAASSSSSVSAIASSMLYSSIYVQLIFLWRGQGLDMMLVSMLPSLVAFVVLLIIKSMAFTSVGSS